MHNGLVWHNRLCHQVKWKESVILRRFEKLGNRRNIPLDASRRIETRVVNSACVLQKSHAAYRLRYGNYGYRQRFFV